MSLLLSYLYNGTKLRLVLCLQTKTHSNMWSSLLYQLNCHNVAFSFTWSLDWSEADACVGDNFIEYNTTQVVSDKHIGVYTMRAATVTTLIVTEYVRLQMNYKYFDAVFT